MGSVSAEAHELTSLNEACFRLIEAEKDKADRKIKPDVDYRKVLSGFRASILSSKQTLTRFKPSRRYGFLYMGKRPRFTTGLLVGVDVSASVSDEDVRRFYSTVNRFFKYGIERIDALAFDASLQGEPLELSKARSSIAFTGRGGTNFQPIIDFFHMNRNSYDGLILFTDGYAPKPSVDKYDMRRLVWICTNKRCYDQHHDWMDTLGRCCYIR